MKYPPILTTLGVCSATLLSLAGISGAQQVLVPENHTWNFLHPMGTMPPRADTTPDPDFDSTWYLPEVDQLRRAQLRGRHDRRSIDPR
jgi:hypothetical protein